MFRIVDNMPVTWCYDVEEEQKFCNPGFPIGCYVTETGLPKDACVVNVSNLHLDIRTELLPFNNCTFLIVCLSCMKRNARVRSHILRQTDNLSS